MIFGTSGRVFCGLEFVKSHRSNAAFAMVAPARTWIIGFKWFRSGWMWFGLSNQMQPEDGQTTVLNSADHQLANQPAKSKTLAVQILPRDRRSMQPVLTSSCQFRHIQRGTDEGGEVAPHRSLLLRQEKSGSFPGGQAAKAGLAGCKVCKRREAAEAERLETRPPDGLRG